MTLVSESVILCVFEKFGGISQVSARYVNATDIYYTQRVGWGEKNVCGCPTEHGVALAL